MQTLHDKFVASLDHLLGSIVNDLVKQAMADVLEQDVIDWLKEHADA